jgi:hypothetical protein
MTLYATLLIEPEKNKIVRFYKLECPVLPVTTIFQILDVSVLKLDVLVSTG